MVQLIYFFFVIYTDQINLGKKKIKIIFVFHNNDFKKFNGLQIFIILLYYYIILFFLDEKYNYYKEGDYIIEIKKKNLEILASRKYLISTYKKFEEKIKPYIESSLPTMLKQKKLYEMKKVNIQKKIYEEKKRKQMNLEMMKKKSEENLHAELLRDVNEITYHISDKINVSEQRDNSFYINDHQNDIIQETNEIQLDSIPTPSNKNIINVEEENSSFEESRNYESSDNSSDLFEEPSPKKRKKVID